MAGGNSATLGFVVHLLIGILVSASYGLLFQRVAPNLASGIGWGLVYGLIGWFIGPLTLLTLRKAAACGRKRPLTRSFPAMVGQLIYSAVAASAFFFLERRHND